MEFQPVKVYAKNFKRKLSNRFNNRDFDLIEALAFIKDYKLDKDEKIIIIDNNLLPLKKVKGKIFAENINLSAMINDKVINTKNLLTKKIHI